MPLNRPVHVGVEQILEGFDSLSKAGDQVFAVWYSDRDIAFQCSMDEKVQRDILQSNLEGLERSGNCDTLYLKMYPASVQGWIDGKTKCVSNTPIQVCEYKGVVSGLPVENQLRPAGMSYDAWEMLKSFKDMPNTIEQKINSAVDAKFTELYGEETEPEPDPMAQTMGMINGLTQNPVIMQLLGKLLEMFNRPAYPAPYQQPTIGMAETTAPPATPQRIPFDEEAMNNALDVLSYHCDLGTCLQKLAGLAQNNPVYFKTLLGMLMSS